MSAEMRSLLLHDATCRGLRGAKEAPKLRKMGGRLHVLCSDNGGVISPVFPNATLRDRTLSHKS
jgi:hypothetical protein